MYPRPARSSRCRETASTGIGIAVWQHRLRRRARRGPALWLDERQLVLAELNSDDFRDIAPAAVYAQLLDEGRYFCSIRTMYWLLGASGRVRERRDQLVHPPYRKPELLATIDRANTQ